MSETFAPGYGLWSLRNECWLTYEELTRGWAPQGVPCVFRSEQEAQDFYASASPGWDGQLAEARDERGGFEVRPLGAVLTVDKPKLEELYNNVERLFCGEGQDMRLYACFITAACEQGLITRKQLDERLTLASGRRIHALATQVPR